MWIQKNTKFLNIYQIPNLHKHPSKASFKIAATAFFIKILLNLGTAVLKFVYKQIETLIPNSIIFQKLNILASTKQQNCY